MFSIQQNLEIRSLLESWPLDRNVYLSLFIQETSRNGTRDGKISLQHHIKCLIRTPKKKKFIYYYKLYLAHIIAR